MESCPSNKSRLKFIGNSTVKIQQILPNHCFFQPCSRLMYFSLVDWNRDSNPSPHPPATKTPRLGDASCLQVWSRWGGFVGQKSSRMPLFLSYDLWTKLSVWGKCKCWRVFGLWIRGHGLGPLRFGYADSKFRGALPKTLGSHPIIFSDFFRFLASWMLPDSGCVFLNLPIIVGRSKERSCPGLLFGLLCCPSHTPALHFRSLGVVVKEQKKPAGFLNLSWWDCWKTKKVGRGSLVYKPCWLGFDQHVRWCSCFRNMC